VVSWFLSSLEEGFCVFPSIIRWLVIMADDLDRTLDCLTSRVVVASAIGYRLWEAPHAVQTICLMHVLVFLRQLPRLRLIQP